MTKHQIKTIESSDFNLLAEEYNYQDELTVELDSFDGDFDQDHINKIVLWKINRYAKLNDESIRLVNSISPSETSMNKEKTKKVLFALLKVSGIGLPMASTILRFRNPNIYQIIDQRAYRILYGKELKLSVVKSEENILTYINYLEKVNDFCALNGLNFTEADRLLYEKDKKMNKGIKIKY